TVKFVLGESIASGALPLAKVELSSSGILIVESIAPTMEVARSTSERTKGFENYSNDLLLKGNNLIFSHPDGFTHDLISGVWQKPTFNPAKTEGYRKGDIIWLLPSDYGTLSTPPDEIYPWTMPADHPFNLLGKPKTYQAQTTFKLYGVRLRSTKDSNTDNPLTDKSCIGSSWVVDDPQAVVEMGSSVLGEYIIYTTFDICLKITSSFSYSGVAFVKELVFPVILGSKKRVLYSANGSSTTTSLTPYYNPNSFTLTKFEARGYEVNGMSTSGTVTVTANVEGVL
ncbi:MAG: hypothetical protein ACRCY4_02440, partial [Brevinema sp.]